LLHDLLRAVSIVPETGLRGLLFQAGNLLLGFGDVKDAP
jgi:hypothetical protein